MTKQYFIELAAFNQNATTIVCTWLDKLDDQQWQRPIVSSFSSIAQTTLHTVSAQNAWVERLQGKNEVTSLQEAFKGTKDALLTLWKASSSDFKAFVTDFDEVKLTDILSFRRFNGEQNRLAYYQIMAHVVNHATYHRGQLVTMLRQVGNTALSSTDLSGFYRGV